MLAQNCLFSCESINCRRWTEQSSREGLAASLLRRRTTLPLFSMYGITLVIPKRKLVILCHTEVPPVSGDPSKNISYLSGCLCGNVPLKYIFLLGAEARHRGV